MSVDGNGEDTGSELAGLLARYSPHTTRDYGRTEQERKFFIVSKLMARHEVGHSLLRYHKWTTRGGARSIGTSDTNDLYSITCSLSPTSMGKSQSKLSPEQLADLQKNTYCTCFCQSGVLI